MACTTNDPAGDIPTNVENSGLEIRISQLVGSDGYAVHQRIRVRVAQPDVGELQSRSRAVGDERIMIMLKHDGGGGERVGVRRRDRLVDEIGITPNLNVQLKSTCRLTEDS